MAEQCARMSNENCEHGSGDDIEPAEVPREDVEMETDKG